MKPNECPKCESTNIGDRWCKGRKLRYYCRECYWQDEPRIPETIPISTTKTVSVNQFYGFVYEIYDKYGHISTYSKTYQTEEEVKNAMLEDLNNCNKHEDYFPCTGIIWPKSVVVNGKVFRTHTNKEIFDGSSYDPCPRCKTQLVNSPSGGITRYFVNIVP